MKVNIQILMILTQLSLIFAAPTILGGVTNDHTYARVDKTEPSNKSGVTYYEKIDRTLDPFIANEKETLETAYEEDMAVLEALKDCFRRVFPYGRLAQSPDADKSDKSTGEEEAEVEHNTGNVHSALESIYPDAMDDVRELNLDDMFSENSNLLGIPDGFISGDHDMDISYEDSDTESSATDEIGEEDKFLDSRQLCVLYSHLFRLEDISL